MPNIMISWETGAHIGAYGLLSTLIILLLQKPERADKIKSLVITPFFRLFRWGARRYIAIKVGSTVSEFINRRIVSQAPSLSQVKVHIKWVLSESDPIFKQDGTLILRMRETPDQTLNMLSATRVALPYVVCPTIRPNLGEETRTAIDLAIVHNLADRLGKHAKPLFQHNFLTIEVLENPTVMDLFQNLLELDDSGLFTTVFLEELNILGENLYASGNTSDKTNEIVAFLKYLLCVARREKRERIHLVYSSPDIRVGIMLLAISQRAEFEGVTPYLQRIDSNIKLGCDSIYLIAYAPATGFIKRVAAATEGDQRITVMSVVRIEHHSRAVQANRGIREILLLRRNTIFTDSAFLDQLEASSVQEGSIISGTVMDVAQKVTFVDALGLNSIINSSECAWNAVSDCAERLSVGDKREFLVKAIDKSRSRLELSLRFSDNDPWKSPNVPSVEDIIEVNIVSQEATFLRGEYVDGIGVEIPVCELSWIVPDPEFRRNLLGKCVKVKIYEKDSSTRTLKASIRKLDDDPWPQIHSRFPKGTELRGHVIEINPNFVRVDLSEGFTGIIPAEAMLRAGYEYADFQNTLVVGQGLDVVVTKVFIKKRRIRLDLKRNIVANVRE